jgi:hypothetical protein
LRVVTRQNRRNFTESSLTAPSVGEAVKPSVNDPDLRQVKDSYNGVEVAIVSKITGRL